MVALSTQPCTAWPAGCCRAPPEAAPRHKRREGRAACRHSAHRPYRRDGHPKRQGAAGHPPTHTTAPGPLPPAALAGPLPPRQPPRPMGNSEAGARQHPNPAMEACGPAPIWRASPAEPERSPLPSLPPRSLPPAPLTSGRSRTCSAARARTPSHPLAPGARL